MGETTATLRRPQCDARTIKGTRCRNSAKEGSAYCGRHSVSRTTNARWFENTWYQLLTLLLAVVGILVTVRACNLGATSEKQNEGLAMQHTGLAWQAASLKNQAEMAQDLRRVETKIPTNPIPGLPEIQIGTFDGQPLFGDQVTANPDFKMIRLYVRNTNDVDVLSFCSRLQLPEPVVVSSQHTQKSTGIEMSWRPLRQTPNTIVSGVGSNGIPASVTREASHFSLVTAASPGSTAGIFGFVDPGSCFDPGEQRSRRFAMVGAASLTGIWELAMDKLPPGGFVTIYFSVSNGTNATNYISFVNGDMRSAAPRAKQEPERKPKLDGELLFYWEGEFQFHAESRLKKQRFFVPLFFDTTQRNLVQLSVQVDKGRCLPVTLDFGY